MQEWNVSQQEEGRRLDRYLMKMLPKAPASLLYKMLRTRTVKVNGRRAEPSAKIAGGDRIQIYFSDERLADLGYRSAVGPVVKAPAVGAVPIVYEDSFLVIFNKPANMLSQKNTPDSYSLSEYFLDYLSGRGDYRPQESRGYRPGLCNRLDRNTTGIVVGAKTLPAAQAVTQAIRERRSRKTYLAVCLGSCPWTQPRLLCHEWSKDGRNNQVSLKKAEPISALPAGNQVLCRAQALTVCEKYHLTLFRIELITGKSHQLRAQLSAEGYPILGDHKYRGTGQTKTTLPFQVSNQLLHAFSFCMQDAPEPLENLSGRVFCAPLPDAFRQVLELGFPSWLQILGDQGEENV